MESQFTVELLIGFPKFQEMQINTSIRSLHGYIDKIYDTVSPRLLYRWTHSNGLLEINLLTRSVIDSGTNCLIVVTRYWCLLQFTIVIDQVTIYGLKRARSLARLHRATVCLDCNNTSVVLHYFRFLGHLNGEHLKRSTCSITWLPIIDFPINRRKGGNPQVSSSQKYMLYHSNAAASDRPRVNMIVSLLSLTLTHWPSSILSVN